MGLQTVSLPGGPVDVAGLVVAEPGSRRARQVANVACSMSAREDGVKMVRLAAAQIESLRPQVVNAARVLAARPRSKVALDNMDVFRGAWEAQVRLLTEAVDDITTIDDFLAVSGERRGQDVVYLFIRIVYKAPCVRV